MLTVVTQEPRLIQASSQHVFTVSVVVTKENGKSFACI